jgi:hypothetical protein
MNDEIVGWDLWKRGDICVIRSIRGQLEVLRLHNKREYREWLGCFSVAYPTTTESKTLDKSAIV